MPLEFVRGSPEAVRSSCPTLKLESEFINEHFTVICDKISEFISACASRFGVRGQLAIIAAFDHGFSDEVIFFRAQNLAPESQLKIRK